MIYEKEITDGVYGIIYLGKDQNNKEVIIKRNKVETTINGIGSIRELDISYKLKGHPNIIQLLAVSYGSPFTSEKSWPPLKNKEYDDDVIHFILEKGNYDLSDYLYGKTREKLTFETIKCFLFDILNGLNYMHSIGYIHRDIKPANLIIFQEKRKILKICDFGLSKPRHLSGNVTPRILTSWYRPPEIIRDYAKNKYDYALDIWSVGAILYELLIGVPLCNNCRDDSEELLNSLYKNLPKKCFNTNEYEYKLCGISDSDFEKRIKVSGTELFISLMNDMLSFDPEKRPTAANTLKNPLFTCMKVINMNVKTVIREKISNPDRNICASIVFDIFNKRSELEWYKHQILFQCISLFDRFLLVDKNKKHSKDGLILRVITCLYISIKYFLTVEPLISLKSFLSEEYRNDDCIRFILNFEIELIRDILKYNIYEPTVYELSDKEMDEKEIRDLLIRYAS